MHQFDPLERLPDPKSKPEDGGARQVQHDLPLPAHLQTALGQPMRVGALEVTPLKVLFTPNQDALILVLDMHNISEDEVFSPVHQEFAESRQGFSSYTFLEPKTSKGAPLRLYGGKFTWEPPATQDQPAAPGRHMVVFLTTREKDKESVDWYLEESAGDALARPGPPRPHVHQRRP